MKSLQQIFTIIVNHLRDQNEKSQEEGTSVCQYRVTNEEGDTLKCAVGCLIDAGQYSQRMEGRSLPKSITDLNDELESEKTFSHTGKLTLLVKALKANGVDIYAPLVLPLLNRLQFIHDETEPAAWENQLSITAHSFGLTKPLHDSVKA